MANEVSSTLVGMQAVEVEEAAPAEELSKPIHRVLKPAPAKLAPVTRPRGPNDPAFLPEAPHGIAATGLSASYLESLCLKHLFQAGDLRDGSAQPAGGLISSPWKGRLAGSGTWRTCEWTGHLSMWNLRLRPSGSMARLPALSFFGK